jgi:hypothetical protein
MRNTAVIMDEGVNILLKTLGVLETELFISTIIKEPAVAKATDDYTEWQREHYANIDLHEFNMRAVQFDKDNPVST